MLLMKKILKITLILALLFSITIGMPSIQVACGFSQTFELGQGVYTGITAFNLQVGDHVEGSFSVSNLGPYERLFGSGTSYEVVDLWCKDPNGQTVLNFSATPSENSFNFSFTAHEQGSYHIWTFSGAMDYIKDAKNPVLTLNFDIVEAKTPPPSPTPLPNQEPSLDIAVTAVIIAFIVVGVLAVYFKKRKH
jgi:hypothetical protein